MFGTGFVNGVLAAASQGQPAWLAGPMDVVNHLIALQPAGWNMVFAALQLLIGLGLLFRTTVKEALLLSFAWVAGVWTLGEGMGGIRTGSPGRRLPRTWGRPLPDVLGGGPVTGGIFGGMATDPNRGPLFVLLALALFPNRTIPRRGRRRHSPRSWPAG